MLKLAKNNTPEYDYFSEGDGTDPITVSVSLTNLGGTVTGSVTAYLVATTFNYTDILVEFVNELAHQDWEMSLDGVNFYESLTPSAMDSRATNIVTTIYLRCVVDNDGTVTTGRYTTPDITVSAVESA